MSHKKTPSRCLVIDASIARAAGGHQTTAPTGARCRDFLEKVRGVCHRMAWGPETRREWLEHRSGFAFTWLTSMQNLKKLRLVADTPAEDLLGVVESVADQAVQAIIKKDAHLVAAALAAEQRIVSLDDKVRGHLARHFGEHAQIGGICWVNPSQELEQGSEWLESGAPLERSRRLSTFQPSES